MATSLVIHASDNAGRGPSGGIWHDCPWDEFKLDPNMGYVFWDDFMGLPLEGTQTTQISWPGTPYKLFAASSGYVRGDPTFDSVETPGGIIACLADTDDECTSFAMESNPFKISGVAATSGKLWFECRVAISSAVTNGIGFMVGLAESKLWALATALPFTGSAGEIDAAAAFIGFHYPEDDTTTADTVYSDRATSFTKVADAEVTGIADFTWTKLGFVYDPDEATDCITFFQDGVALATKVSRATIVALTNLDVGTLGLIFSQIADASGTSITSHLDWWRCAQRYYGA